ncbi:acetyl-CoA synthetase-like protein [Ramaria rubella]|nr:acetyl-CoA synthetase-like protein [Ramaria rubella]
MVDTFKPLNCVNERTVLVPDLIKYHGKHSPNHPLFVYLSSPNKLEIITWSKAAQAIENAAHLVCSYVKDAFQRGSPPPVIGILANIDSITYHTLSMGIARAGASAFLISTRNSPPAVTQLLKKTSTHTLFVSADEPMQRLATAALESPELRDVRVQKMPSFADLYSEESIKKYTESIPDYSDDLVKSPAVILHSSGTTSFPKPVFVSHRHVLQWSECRPANYVDGTKHRLAAHGMPVFHGLGYITITWAAFSGISLAVFPPLNTPVVLSPHNVLEEAISSRSTMMMTVPLFVEIWSRDAETVERLKQFAIILYGGGPLNKPIGDELSQAGVCLGGLYGTTESGPNTQSIIGGAPEEWDWLVANPRSDPIFLPQEDQPNIFEMVFVDCPTQACATSNCDFEGKRAFATNDLVVKHPTNPRKFKILGRKDDQIMLSSGEKTNPGPLEAIICKSSLVQFAVMFGRGREQNGILLQPAAGREIDPNDEVALSQYRDDVWPTVEAANTFAPAHSRVFKEMILVTHPRKPMELTAKLGPRRAFVLEMYKNEIEAAYSALESHSNLGIAPPSEWTLPQPEVLYFVRKTVYTVMAREKSVNDDDDIFQRGADSLQATYIRNALLQAVRGKRKESVGQVSQSFVYDNPTITQLTNQLLDIVQSDPGMCSHDDKSHLENIRKLISEFSCDFPAHRPSTVQSSNSSGEVVLLTGTTGGLGSQLLAHAVSSPSVKRVYALNRPATPGHVSLCQRQRDALTQRGLDANIPDHPKVTLVECDLAADYLGIPNALYDEIRDNITLIIHNAWRVNFNLSLSSFTPMIRGVRNLVNLTLHSPKPAPPRFIFTSTVGVYRNWKALSRPLEAPIEDPQMVLGSGYSESKWISERILEEAAKTTPLRPIIVRIGQMTSNHSGAWNSGDWLPAIVRSGQVIGALPFRDDPIAWISLESAAQAIFEFRTSQSQYLNLAHPNPVPWNTVFDVFSSILNVPLVSWNEWLAKLEKDKNGPEINPALHLLQFFRDAPPMVSEGREALGVPLLDLTEALVASLTLSDPSLPQISSVDAERWIKYWKRTGYLTK